MSVFAKGPRRATRLERVIIVKGDSLERLAGLLPGRVRDLFPASGPTKDASDHHPAFLENHLFQDTEPDIVLMVAPDAEGYRWFDAVRFRFTADDLAAVMLTFGFGAMR
jgi:hypothetical protein